MNRECHFARHAAFSMSRNAATTPILIAAALTFTGQVASPAEP
jgi:hypothetical protein